MSRRPWIIRRLSGYSDVIAEHRATGIRVTLTHKDRCLCEDCLDISKVARRVVERWLRSLPEPPDELQRAVGGRGAATGGEG